MRILFPSASAIALSLLFAALLSPAFILNLIQFSVHPSLEMMPCLIAFFFSEAVFHKSQWHANMSKSSMLNISFLSNLTANFLMIALPMLLTNVLFGSAVVDIQF